MKGNINELDVLKLYDDGLSTHQIAKKYSTYPNKIRRILIKNGKEPRTRSEAQKVALEAGVSTHPTKGRERTAEEKLAISASSVKHWNDMSDDEREQRREKSRAAWKSMSPIKREEMRKKAAQRIREAAKTGSKLEKKIQKFLVKAGYKYESHKKVIPTQKFEFDLYLPQLRTIIEVDGLSHFEPIWGEEQLSKQQLFDQQKDGLVLSRGFKLIRVENISGSMALVKLAELEREIVSALEQIKSGNGENLKVIKYE